MKKILTIITSFATVLLVTLIVTQFVPVAYAYKSQGPLCSYINPWEPYTGVIYRIGSCVQEYGNNGEVASWGYTTLTPLPPDSGTGTVCKWLHAFYKVGTNTQQIGDYHWSFSGCGSQNHTYYYRTDKVAFVKNAPYRTVYGFGIVNWDNTGPLWSPRLYWQ